MVLLIGRFLSLGDRPVVSICLTYVLRIAGNKE